MPPIVPLPTDDVKYVSLPNARNWDTPDNGNFIAHEVGHYLGLFHTHPGWGTGDLYPASADTAAKAEQALVDFAAAHGGAPGAFNGDLLSDTNPDCCRNIYDLRGLSHTSSGPSSITIKGKGGGKDVSFTLTPPRDNLMSYFFWGAPQKLTAQQKATVQKTLQSDRRRILIEPPCWPDFHRVPNDRFQVCFDYWRNRGLEPHTLSCTDTHISGSFQSGPRMPVWTMLTSADYQKRFDQYFAQNMRPARVTVAETGAGARYTGIWQTIEAAFHANHRMTIADFDAEWHAKRKAGWLHTDLYIYRDGGKLLASSTWVKKKWDDYATYYGMSADEYVQRRRISARRVWPSPPSARTWTAASGGTAPSGRRSPARGRTGSTCPPPTTSRSTTSMPARGTASTRSRPTGPASPRSGRSRAAVPSRPDATGGLLESRCGMRGTS